MPSPDGWRFKTPVIEFGGAAKAIQWDQRQRGDPDNVASRGGYRMKFYEPEAFDGFLTAEFPGARPITRLRRRTKRNWGSDHQ
jgi:hypothetical protein